jgi:hypothetical protein
VAVRVTLATLGAAADGILAVFADEAARTGEKRWLEQALVTGDILGGRGQSTSRLKCEMRPQTS